MMRDSLLRLSTLRFGPLPNYCAVDLFFLFDSRVDDAMTELRVIKILSAA